MRKIIALSLAAVLMISLFSGCSNKEEDAQGTSAATGRYLEEEIALPQEGRIVDIQILENGAIGNIMTNDDSMMTLWSSADYGQTWEREYDVPIELEEYVATATLIKDGTILFTTYLSGASEMEIEGKTWKIDTQGNREEIKIDLPEVELAGEAYTYVENEESAEESAIIMEDNMADEIWDMQISEQGKVIVSTMMGKIMQVDIETGEILREYEMLEETYTTEFVIVNEDIYVQTDTGLQRYDIETGDKKEVSEALSEKVSGNSSNDGIMYMQPTGVVMASKVGEAEESIYMADDMGIYRQSEEGTVLEQIVDAGLTSLGMPSIMVNKMLALADDSLLVCSENTDSWESALYRYVYYADAKTTPEVEVQMYALEDNREIRQAIAMYQKENPDTVVSLQIGMTGEDGTTVSDALNALNTEIMAGNGPDILVLDGMPIDSYIEKGILEDISDVVNQIDEQYGILKTGENTHAIATRFSVPYVQGEAKYVDSIEDIVTLQETLKEAKSEYPDRQSISGGDVERLMQHLYPIYVNSFITQEGEIEKEKLQTFLQQAKEIAETNYGKEDSDEEQGIVSGMTIGEEMVVDATNVAMGLLVKEASVGRGEVRTQNDLAVILGTNSKMDITHKVMTDDEGETLLLTNTILGINSKGEQIEKAKEILEFCLSKEVQVSEQGMGLPVNKEALGETLRKEMGELGLALMVQTDDGVTDTVELTISRPEESDIEKFEQDILGDVKIGYFNRIVEEIVVEQLMEYVEDRMTLDEAVEGINQKVSLYLSE